jgi:blue copper oxidase
MKRRRLLQGLATLGLGASGAWVLWRPQEPEPLPLEQTAAGVQFPTIGIAPGPVGQNPLRIPDLLDGELRDGVRHFALQTQHGLTRFFPEFETATLGINGSYLGPTLRLRCGEPIAIDVHNAMTEETTLHWHGLNVPAVMDGGPQQIIAPAAHWQARFTLDQHASTCWYHSHLHHRTGPQVYQGLAGMLLVESAETAALELPSRYGVDDIPVILQDRRFGENGVLEYPTDVSTLMRGVRGETLLVNGTLAPYLDVRTQKLRLRLLNAANARSFTIARSDEAPFALLAGDSSFLEAPLQVNSVTLSPGERAEIVLDIAPGQPFYLVNLPVSPYPAFYNGQMNGMMRSLDKDAFDVLEIRPALTLESSPALPAVLTSLARLRAEDAKVSRYFELGMGNGPGNGGGREGRGAGGGGNGGGNGGGFGGGVFKLNGMTMDMARIDFEVQEGAVEIWELRNISPMIHPFHIHKVHFEILDRNGQPPPPEERGLKDTVRVHISETVRVIARFAGHPDPLHPYMFHCHILEHEDHGMMGQFVVV